MTKKIIFGIGEQFLQREGLQATVMPWEDGLRTSGTRGDFEWWYFDAHFQDGSTAVIVFFTKPLLNRTDPLAPGYLLTITRPDGVKLFKFIMLSPADFSSSRDGCDVQAGKSWVRGDLRSYAIHVEAEELQGIVPAWRPGSGINYYNENLTRFFAWLPAIPHGSANGVLSYDGNKVKVKGSCYHDHNWGNINLAAVIYHWYWGRAHVGDYTAIFIQMHARPSFGGVKIPVFMLAKGDQILTGDGQPLTLKLNDVASHPSGKTYPRRAEFLWQKGDDRVVISLHDPRMIESASLLGTLPAWQQWLARLVTNPYYFRFNAAVDLDVKLGNIREHQQGLGLYEVMYLR